jgi:hypothetical protein
MILSQETSFLLLSATLFAAGCGPDAPPPPAPTASGSAKLEADPSALVESPCEVLGIRMPVGTKPKLELPDYAVLYLPYAQERVSNYLRERVDGSIDVGPKRTVFSSVTLRSTPEGRHLTIVVEPDGFGSKVTMKQLPKDAIQ